MPGPNDAMSRPLYVAVSILSVVLWIACAVVVTHFAIKYW